MKEPIVTNKLTAKIVRRIKQENDAANKALIRFFDSNPGFDFRSAGIDSYLADNPDALAQIASDEKQSLVWQLNKLQRLFWLTDDTPDQYAAMRRLIDDGLDSAQAIASMDVEAFCSRYPENSGLIAKPRSVNRPANHLLNPFSGCCSSWGTRLLPAVPLQLTVTLVAAPTAPLPSFGSNTT